MHILHIPSWFETPSRPTAGKAVKDLAIALSRQGISNTIFFQSEFDLPEIRLAEGISIYHSTYSETFFDKIFFGGNALKIFSRRAHTWFTKSGRPDIIHAHGFKALTFAYHLFKEQNIPFVYTEHSSIDDTTLKNKIKRRMLVKMLQCSKANIAVSNYLAQKLNFSNLAFHVIPNCIDFDLFTLSAERKDHWIMINLLTGNKQVHKGIEAFIRYKKLHIHSALYIVGDGPEGEKLRNQYKEKDVIFLGEKPVNEWLSVLQTSTCLFLMSKSETFGVVVVEALACGKPVVCLDNGGVMDIVEKLPQDQKMLTVLPQHCSLEDICNKAENSVNEFSESEAQKIRNILAQAFDFSNIAHQYVQIYKSAVKK